MGMDIYGRKPTTEDGEYFSASIFTWAPLLAFARTAIELANLSMDTEGWQYNDGKGPQTQEECNALADAMQLLLSGMDSPVIHADHLESTKAVSKVFGGIEPQAEVHRERVEHFIAFLRGCGGFKTC